MNKNLRRNSIISFLLMTFISLSAQNINDFYMKVPDIIDPVLSQKQRFELLEYYKAGMGDSVANRFNNQSHIIHLDSVNNYIKVKNTAVSVFEMKLIQQNDDSIIGIIRTVCSPICSSTIDFYDTKWNKYPMKFDMPVAKEWLSDKMNQDEYNNIANMIKTGFISLSFDTIKPEIIAQNNTLEYLDDIDKEQVKEYFKSDPIVYELKNNSWSGK